MGIIGEVNLGLKDFVVVCYFFAAERRVIFFLQNPMIVHRLQHRMPFHFQLADSDDSISTFGCIHCRDLGDMGLPIYQPQPATSGFYAQQFQFVVEGADSSRQIF